MQSNYIVKTKDNILLNFYCTKQHELFCKPFENARWASGHIILNAVRDGYSITMAQDGTIYLFCQDLTGNIILCQSEDAVQWKKTVILKNQSSQQAISICFNGLITENGMHLIYNVPVPNENSQLLMSQTVQSNGVWSEADTIDKIVPLPDKLFELQHITLSHALLFYRKKTPESRLGYREFTVTELSDFNLIHTTPYQILETSFLTTGDALHVLYVIKAMFSTQIIYRKKTGARFEPAVTVWESGNISNCMITIIENKLYITWISASRLYVSASDDGGQSFKRPAAYQKRFSPAAVKAHYISFEPMTNNKFVCREIYMDCENNFDLLFLPDLYRDFYPKEPLPKQALIQEEKNAGTPDVFAGFANPPEMNEADLLKGKLTLYKSKLDEKDRQILTLDNLLQSRNKEIAALDERWSLKCRSLKEDADAFKRSRDSLLKENKKLKQKIHSLEKKFRNLPLSPKAPRIEDKAGNASAGVNENQLGATNVSKEAGTEYEIDKTVTQAAAE